MSPDPVELFGFTAASHSSDEPPITAVLAATERLDLLIVGDDVDLDPAGAVLTDLTERAGMDQLLTETQHLSPREACEVIVRRTCRFWHSERQLLRPLFGWAAIDHEVAAILA